MKRLLILLCVFLILPLSACKGEESILADAEEMMGYIGSTVEEVKTTTGEEILQLGGGTDYRINRHRNFAGGDYTLFLQATYREQEVVLHGEKVLAPEGTIFSFFYIWSSEDRKKETVQSLEKLEEQLKKGYGEPATSLVEHYTKGELIETPLELRPFLEERRSCMYQKEWMTSSGLQVLLNVQYEAVEDLLHCSIRYQEPWEPEERDQSK